MKKFICTVLMMVGLTAPAFAVSGTVTLINSPALAYSTAVAQNLFNFATTGGVADNLAIQVTYASATIASQSFTGGQQSTGSITVVSTQALVAVQATNTLIIPSTTSILGSPATGYITVIATTGLLGTQASFTTTLSNYAGIAASSPSITLDGQNTFTYGGNWASTDTLNDAASTLAAAINAGKTFTAVANSAQVAITYVAYGTGPNGTSITSSSGTDISTGQWAGGRNPVTVTINNTFQNFTFTYGQNWTSTDTVTHAATILASIINGIGDPFSNLTTGGIVSSSVGGVISSTAEVNGTFGNGFTMATSSSPLVSISSSNFSGGLNRSLLNAAFFINGTPYGNGQYWTDAANTSTATIASILAFVNGISTQTATCNSGINDLMASWSAAQTITFTQAIGCSAGNTMTLTVTSGSGLTAGAATFAGGQDNASFNINGTTLQYPTNWNLGTSSTTTTTALSIAGAINANAVINKLVVSTNVTNVVRATSTANGSLTNYTLISSTPALLVAGFTGGTNTAFSSGSATIALPANNFTTALPVVYSSAGVVINGLTNQTTYYVIVVDSNDVQLSTSSAQAIAGVPIILRSTDTTTTAHNFTLAPLPWVQGSAGGLWQVSNDAINWVTYTANSQNIPISSNTFTAINPSTTTVQDFGAINYQYIRYNVTGPTQGGINLKVILATKD